jgi:DNA invertase Pin-like site-specific DNA recombinase
MNAQDTKPMRIATYARVSTDRQDLEVQLQELRDFAARRGWTIVGAYEDVISGAHEQRPGLDRLVADAHRRTFDLVLLWKLDRLGRSLLHMVQVMDDLLRRGIDVVSATEPHLDSTTPQGRLLRNIFASVAEYERELIRERVRAGIRRAKAKGVRLGRPSCAFDEAKALALYRECRSWRQVARTLGVSLATLHRRLAERTPLQAA